MGFWLLLQSRLLTIPFLEPLAWMAFLLNLLNSWDVKRLHLLCSLHYPNTQRVPDTWRHSVNIFCKWMMEWMYPLGSRSSSHLLNPSLTPPPRRGGGHSVGSIIHCITTILILYVKVLGGIICVIITCHWAVNSMFTDPVWYFFISLVPRSGLGSCQLLQINVS